MPKINILFVMIQIETGGAERLIHNLALKIDRNIFNPSVAYFIHGKMIGDFKSLGIPIYYVPKLKRIDLSAMLQLSNIIRRNKIHVVNAHHFMPMVYSFYGCKIKNNIKLIYTEHSILEIEQIKGKWGRVGSYFLKHADRTVGVTEEVTKSLQKKFKICPSKTLTIQNGVDLELFSHHHEKITLKKKLGLADNDETVGMVANFRKIKNHIFILEAFKELLNEYKNVKLLLIGKGFKGDAENSEQEIRNFIKNNGLDNHVLILGQRADIPDLLNIMDIFCLTSFKEGLPISLLEAMATGLPLVGSEVEGIKDVIIHGKNGFLVPVGDINGLKKALLTLLRSGILRDKMGRESKALANKLYSLGSCINQYQNLFISGIN